MNLGTRLALAFAMVAASVAAAVGVLAFYSTVERLNGEVDRALQTAATAVVNGYEGVLQTPVTDRPGGPPDGRGDRSRQLIAQRIAPDGTVTPLGGQPVTLPVRDTDRTLASDTQRGATSTTEVAVADGTGGVAYRVLTTALGEGRGAVQVGVDIVVYRQALGGLAKEVTLLALLVTVVAAGLGWLLARRIARRLVRLTAIAEDVSAIGPGAGEVPVQGRDEVARLSSSFNTMLRRLAASREAQERLIQDAAHELRTPLTSLRTNTSVLRHLDRLDPASRGRLLADVEGETRELSHLVEELITLALARRTGEEEDDEVDLAPVVRAAADRTRRRSGRTIGIDSDGTRVRGRRNALDRAVGNLLENAAKFDTGGTGPIDIRVRRGTITVSDRGPGLDPADVDRVFDRFYRSDAARSLPGSGLGLAIVADIAEAHDGTAFARNRPGGGAAIGITIGARRLLPDSDSHHDPDSPGPATVVGS
ncbi:HAMP domain-containing sensor histidine kinase [Pseudonocardia sp. MH-G8]|uniref:HAMP domain-containing sensor histidine kinase n=1 Tax=Pseudonocardia sp. MH-G8 TaxID=1854588 RepID=UPI000BA0F774|nr:HAMP domain-containing sensor histidine kinase [Pseudonocardia sp. MH-G8]OZM79011.1 two-component sensor histidine kinase [Pseudonocardia sp. MH-G8]